MKNYIKLFEEFDSLSPEDTSDLRSMGFGSFSWRVHLSIDEYRAASFTPEEIETQIIEEITGQGLHHAGEYQIELASIKIGNWDPNDWNDFDPDEDGYPDGADVTVTFTLNSYTEDYNKVWDWVQSSLMRYSRCLDDIISIDQMTN